MVGAGALIKPLLGFPYEYGVIIVGVVVTLIVVTAGMVSTTWVQFIKGSLLVIFCGVLTLMILHRGFTDVDDGRRRWPQTQSVTSPTTGQSTVDGAEGTPNMPTAGDLRPVGHVHRAPRRQNRRPARWVPLNISPPCTTPRS